METLIETYPHMKWYQKIVVIIVFAIWLGITYTETPRFIIDWHINYGAFRISELFGFGMSIFVLFSIIPFVAIVCAYIVKFPVWLVNRILIKPIVYLLRIICKNKFTNKLVLDITHIKSKIR